MGTRGQGRQVVTTAGVRKAVVAFVVLVLGWCLLAGAWSDSDSSPVQASAADSNGFPVEPAMTPETLADEPIVPLVCGVNLDCSDVHTKTPAASKKSSPTVTRRHTTSSRGTTDSVTTKTATGSTTVTTRTTTTGKSSVTTSTTSR